MSEQIPTDLTAKLKDKENIMKPSVIIMTPQKATAYMNVTKTLGFKNRSINQGLLEKLCKDLKERRWIPNGATIVIDKDGAVIDGQHRLLACIKTGIPFITAIAKNVDREAFATIDCGCTRSASQVLRMENVRYHKHIAAMISGIQQIRNKTLMSKGNRMTNTDVLEFWKEHGAMLDKIITTVFPSANLNKHLSPRLAGAALFVLVTDYGYSWEKASDFILGCLSSETHSNGFINALRNKLHQNTNTKLADGIKFYNLVLVWNAIQNGDRRCPTFRTTFNEYPDFVHA